MTSDEKHFMRWRWISTVMLTLVACYCGLAHGADKYFVTTDLVAGASPIAEPYQPLHGGGFTGQAAPHSPDPLVRYRWRHPQATSTLQYYLLRPVSVSTPTPDAFKGIQSAGTKSCDVTVKGTGSIRFDFGTESAAWLEFDSPDLTGKVEMGVSEFNTPANEAGKLKCIATPQRIGDTYRLELNPQFYEGVRFGWIDVHSYAGKPWHITNVRLVCQIKPTNYNGSFSCSAPMLTRIWYAGAYDVKLNLLKNYFGAILMDRGDRISWTGDAHIAQSAALVAFGNWGFVKKNLDRTANDSNGIASYSLYWVLSLLDYYQYTGDQAELVKYIPNVQTKLTQAAANFNKPKIGFYGWGDRLGDGYSSDYYEDHEAYRMLFIATCRRFAHAMGTIHRTALQKQYNQMAEQHVTLIKSRPDWITRIGIFAASDAINACVPTLHQSRFLYRHVFANPIARLAFSPFNEYFVIKAMGKMNWTDPALQTVLEDWGGQIKYGGTTFFECYRPSWNAVIPHNGTIPSCQCGPTSLCHPWSSGCTTWLTQYVAGIHPTSPGFATVDITPHLGRLLTRVSANAPTPHGIIHAGFDVKRGMAEVVIPQGVVARIGVPKAQRTITAIHVNGKLAWNGRFRSIPGIAAASNGRRRIYFTGVRPGHYTFAISYVGHTPRYVPQPLVYPIKVIGQDATTSGNWGGVYGKQGYVLFDYNGNGNKQHLPSYVKSVTCRIGLYGQWPMKGNDSRALAPNPSNKGQRVAGMMYSGPTSWTGYMVVNIKLKYPHNYQLAIYAVDFDRKGRRETVEVHNSPSLILGAPVQVISHFSSGKYMIFDCHSSVRLNFEAIKGPNAVISGVFFDPPGK